MRVECPNCHKGIQAPSKYRGKVIKCPGCKTPFVVPDLKPKHFSAKAPTPPPLPSTSTSSEETVDCPFCSEPIKKNAKKCKHCGEFLSASDQLQQVVAPPPVMVEALQTQEPVEAPRIIITHEHKAKTSFFRVGFGTGCGCLCAVALALGGCLISTGFFAVEVGEGLADSFEKVEEQRRASESQRREEQRKRAELLVVEYAEYESSGDGISGGTIILRVTNHSDLPVTRIYFHGILQTPGRSVPWAEDNFNYSVPGGLEPGESSDLTLAPSFLSELHDVAAPSTAEFRVVVENVEYFSDDPDKFAD